MKVTLYQYLVNRIPYYFSISEKVKLQTLLNIYEQRMEHQNMLASEVAEQILINMGQPLTEHYAALTEIIANYRELSQTSPKYQTA